MMIAAAFVVGVVVGIMAVLVWAAWMSIKPYGPR